MFRVIIVTHGRLAAALLESAGMILGKVPDGVQGICLCPQDNLESARRKILSALGPNERSGISSQALVLVDLFGGTACNAAAWASEERDFQIIAGVNLPMLLEIMVSRDHLSVSQAALAAMEAGTKSVVDVRAALSLATKPETRES